MKEIIVINAHRSGYGIDQIEHTMTVGELIEALQDFDEETPVYIGNDRQTNGSYYTFGGINYPDIDTMDVEDDDE